MAERLVKSTFPFVAGSYEARSKTFDCSRTVNCFPEMHTSAGKGGEVAALYSTPGLRPVQTLGLGPIRCAYTISNTQLAFIVSGNEVYQLSSAEGVAVQVTGNLSTSSGPVQMVDNGTHVLLVDGTNGYTIDLSVSPALTTIVDPNFYDGAKSVTYQAGYFVLDVPESVQSSAVFFSSPDTIDFPALNILSVDSSPDVVVSVISNNQLLYVLGARTTEVWQLTGASAAEPFSLIPGRTINIGCSAYASVARLAGTFLWLGGNDQGDGVVYSMENDTPTRVSTHAIEHALQQLGDLSTSVALAYQSDGHYFYELNCPGSDTTWVYDLSTKQWHERQSIQNGSIDRHFAQVACFINGEHLVGDYRNGAMYVYDQLFFLDGTEPIRRLRQTPHSSNGLANTFYKTMQVDIQPGVGTLEINPRLVLQISRDGGFTWGNPIYASMGLVGAYRTRARWQRLGYGRDLVFRVFCDDPVNVVYLSAYLDTEVGVA